MEEKKARKNIAWNRLNQETERLKACPFCGNRITTRVAEKTGQRWFDCYTCTMALRFDRLNEKEALEAWNERA